MTFLSHFIANNQFKYPAFITFHATGRVLEKKSETNDNSTAHVLITLYKSIQNIVYTFKILITHILSTNCTYTKNNTTNFLQ